MRTRVGLALLVGTLLTAPPVFATTYAIDPDHSSVTFKIRHLFSSVQGAFNKFDGQITYDPEHPEQWSATATINAGSIDTNVEKRDAHLRSVDFFDVEHFSTITFKSTGATDVTPTTAKLHGDLIIHGVTKPVVLDVAIHGVGKDPWGNVRAGFTATTLLNRKDFGLTWNKAVESGQLLVGEEVNITLEIEGIVK